MFFKVTLMIHWVQFPLCNHRLHLRTCPTLPLCNCAAENRLVSADVLCGISEAMCTIIGSYSLMGRDWCRWECVWNSGRCLKMAWPYVRTLYIFTILQGNECLVRDSSGLTPRHEQTTEIKKTEKMGEPKSYLFDQVSQEKIENDIIILFYWGLN